ncbi:hypothetical protein JW905_16935 [bacterium]|nr:hypothetical protein [candidate division CSSED10-310 bacterium]
MATVDWEKLLGNDKIAVRAVVPVGLLLDDPISKGPQSLSGGITAPFTIKAFEKTLEVNTSTNVSMTVFKNDQPLEAFTLNEKGYPDNGQAFGSFTVNIQAGGDGSWSFPAGAFTFIPSVGCELNAVYRHIMPFSLNDTTYAQAFKKLVTRSNIPALVTYGTMKPGEVHAFSGHLGLNLGLKAQWGKKLSGKLQPFKDIDEAFHVNLKAALEAAFGFILKDDFEVTVARDAGKHNDWVINDGMIRIRARRRRERGLSFSCRFSLLASYDLSSPLLAILEETMRWRPVKGFFDEVEKISEWSDLVAGGKWDELATKMAGTSVDWLSDYFTVNDFFQALKTNPTIQTFIKNVLVMVEGYQALDDKLLELWQETLKKVDLGADQGFRTLLEKIAQLKDVTSMNEVMTILGAEDWSYAVELLETITGYSIENMWIGDGESALMKIHEAGEKAQAFLEFLDTIDDSILARLRGFFERTGVDALMNWLAENATSVDALRNASDTYVKRFVAEFIGKGIDRIKEEDRKRISAVAKKVKDILDHIGSFEDDLNKEINKLKGDLGFDLAFEIGRVASHEAVLDIEIDPNQDALIKMIAEGKIKKAMNKHIMVWKDNEKEDTNENDVPPFSLRECMFTSTKAINKAWTTVLSFIGVKKDFEQRIISTTVKCRQSADDSILHDGTYSGTWIKTCTDEKAEIESMGSCSLVYHAYNAVGNFSKNYSSHDSLLRFGFSITRPPLDDREIEFSKNTLQAVGFKIGSVLLSPLCDSKNSKVRISFNVGLPCSAAKKLAEIRSESPDWDLVFLNAAYAWFRDGIDISPYKDTSLYKGQVLAEVMKNPVFKQEWTSGSATQEFSTAVVKKMSKLTIRVKEKEFQDILEETNGNFAPPFMSLSMIHSSCSSRGAHGRFSKIKNDICSIGNDAHYQKMVGSFSKGIDQLSYHSWKSPLFPLWLTLAALALTNQDEILAQAKGIALLERKIDGKWEKVGFAATRDIGMRMTEYVERALFPIT